MCAFTCLTNALDEGGFSARHISGRRTTSIPNVTDHRRRCTGIEYCLKVHNGPCGVVYEREGVSKTTAVGSVANTEPGSGLKFNHG